LRRGTALIARDHASWAAIALILAGCGWVGAQAHHLTFNADDWQFVLYRRGLSLDVFLRPHAQSLAALVVLAFKVLLAAFGFHSYLPFMVLLLVVHGVACGLLYVLARRWVGAWAALAPTAILVVLGPAWHDLLFATQMGYIGSVAAGLGMVRCLERRDRRGDTAAAALLAVSLLWSSIGVGMIALAAVLIGLQRQRAWRLWVAALPFALYFLWQRAYGVSAASGANVSRLPTYLFRSASAAFASVSGVGQTPSPPFLVSIDVGRYVALAAAALLVVHVVRGGRLPPTAWAALVAAVTLWTVSALAYYPSREAQQSRYQYAGAAMILLAGVSVAGGRRPGRSGGLILGALTLAIVGSNLAILDRDAAYWRQNSAYSRAEVGVIQVARNVVAPDFAPNDLVTYLLTNRNSLLGIEAGPYFRAVDAYGSPADRPADVVRESEPVREAADLVLADAERLKLSRGRPHPPEGASCRSAPRAADLREISVGSGALWVRVGRGTDAQLQVRRFARRYRFDSFGASGTAAGTLQLKSGRPALLSLPTDRSALPWRARLVGGQRVRFCFAARR
jgi:hypothetical protein